MGFKDVNTIGKPSVCGQPEIFGSRVADMLERDFVSIGTIEISLALSQQPGLTFGAANSFGLTYKVGEVIGLYTREFLWRRSFAQKARKFFVKFFLDLTQVLAVARCELYSKLAAAFTEAGVSVGVEGDLIIKDETLVKSRRFA